MGLPSDGRLELPPGVCVKAEIDSGVSSVDQPRLHPATSPCLPPLEGGA